MFVLTAFCFLGGLLGGKSLFLSGKVALVWPPSGLALAAILLFGYRFWPGIAIGAVVCVYLLNWFVDFQNGLGCVRDAADWAWRRGS